LDAKHKFGFENLGIIVLETPKKLEDRDE